MHTAFGSEKFVTNNFTNVSKEKQKDTADVILTYEKACLIIEEIDIFQKMIGKKNSLLNFYLTPEKQQKKKKPKLRFQIFVLHFKDEIKNNEFVNYTIQSIKIYFSDQSFLTFDQAANPKERCEKTFKLKNCHIYSKDHLFPLAEHNLCFFK